LIALRLPWSSRFNGGLHFLRMAAVPSQVARALAKLAAVGASLGLLIALLAVTDRVVPFLVSNTLPASPRPLPPTRLWLILGIVVGAVVPVVAGLLYILSRKERDKGLARAGRLADLLGPLALAFAVPALFEWRFGQDAKLLYLFTLALFGLLLYRLMVPSMAALAVVVPRRWTRLSVPRAVCLGIVIAGAVGYAVYMSYYSIQQHRQVATTAFDLGIYDNLMYNALHGKLFRSPVCFGPGERNYLASHAEFAMLLFLPFYAIRPGSETMLLIQAVMLGGAAIPLYYAARTLLPPLVAVVVSLSFLMFAPLHGPQFYDFHWLPLALFFHFLFYYAIANKRRWLTIASLIILYAFREDVAVGLCAFGIFLLVTGLRPGFGGLLAVISAVWFVIDRFVIMELAGSWWFENMYSALFADGRASYGSVIQTLISNPIYVLSTLMKEEKLVYVLHMLAPLAFVPVRRPALVLLMLGGAVFTVLTTGYGPTVQISFQYTTHWIPYLFLALILGLVTLSRETGGKYKLAAATVVVALTLASHSYNYGAVLQHNSFVGGFRRVDFGWTKAQQHRYRDLHAVAQQIPADASVTATEYMVPHVSHHETVYVLTRVDSDPMDFIFFSTLELSNDVRTRINGFFAKAPYGLVDHRGEFYLLRKGHVNPQTKSVMAAIGITVP
jgi:uncharacterized membrane protein